MKSLESYTCHTEHSEVSCNTESSLDLPLESLSLQPFLQSLHKEQWQEVRLGEVAEITSSKRIFYSEYVEYGIPFYRSKEIIEFSKGNNPQNELFIDENKYNDIANKFGVPQANDILLTSVGTLGIPYLVPKDKKFYFKDGNLTWFKNFKNITSLFLFYWFKSPQGKEKLDSIAIGSTQQALTIQGMKNLIFLLPPLTIQQKIAEILSSFDDKIDLLHRQNKTLESLALTLFRHYFIDNPKRNEWEEKPLSEVAYFLNGLACQKLPPRNDKDRLPVLKIKELKEGISQASDWATSEIDSQYIVENGDVIFAWSASLMVKMWNGSRCVLNQHLFKVTSQVYPKWFYYFWCKYHLQDFIAIANAHATTMGHIKRQDLDLAMCVIPDTQSLQTIDKEIAPLLQKININSKQIQNLQAMRDMLLKAIFA